MIKQPKLVDFESTVRKRLKAFIKKHSTETKTRKIAVFDADGTLWHGDVGEMFLYHQIKDRSLTNKPSEIPWEKLWDTYFQESTKGDAVLAYGWLAQWNKGMKESQMQELSREFFETHWLKRIFKPMQELVKALTLAGFECWVVSGSTRWIVQEGVKHFGVPANRVIATSVDVEGGLLTDLISHGIVPYRAGKSQLVKKLIETAPLFGVGNTYWDKELIETASELGLTISSENPDEVNYESEQKLRELAEQKGWLVQRFSARF